jgi:hypothetical protein
MALAAFVCWLYYSGGADENRGNHMAKKKKPKVKRKRTGKRSKPKKRSTRKVGDLTPIVSDDEALERAYSF